MEDDKILLQVKRKGEGEQAQMLIQCTGGELIDCIIRILYASIMSGAKKFDAPPYYLLQRAVTQITLGVGELISEAEEAELNCKEE